VLLIEHNMPVVMDLSHRITVMDNGRILAEGTPEEIQANPEVRRAYLGT
jgi:branched-chain amino acid transport system ATP-binding protein